MGSSEERATGYSLSQLWVLAISLLADSSSVDWVHYYPAATVMSYQARKPVFFFAAACTGIIGGGGIWHLGVWFRGWLLLL